MGYTVSMHIEKKEIGWQYVGGIDLLRTTPMFSILGNICNFMNLTVLGREIHPTDCSGGVIKIIEEEALTSPHFVLYTTQLMEFDWEKEVEGRPYSFWAGPLFSEVLPYLLSIAPPEKTRLVYWFDY